MSALNNTEHGTCDFCGERDTVAVSEQHRGKVSICKCCAEWAIDKLRTAADAKREAKA